MPSIEASRHAFLNRIRRYTHPSERPYFEAALDDFIDWSSSRAPELVHSDNEYDQDVVSFLVMPRAIVLWSAYPRIDGAKLEILPGSADTLSASMRHEAVRALRSISREPISESTTLRIPFASLKTEPRRRTVKGVLDCILAGLLDTGGDPHEPAALRSR
jgi:hypothetical protein